MSNSERQSRANTMEKVVQRHGGVKQALEHLKSLRAVSRDEQRAAAFLADLAGTADPRTLVILAWIGLRTAIDHVQSLGN